MRSFYLLYRDRGPILQTASGQSGLPAAPRPFTLGWSHYVFLLGVKNPEERSFYEIEATEQNWTVRELRRQFDSGLYERLAFSRDKEGIRKLAREGQVVAKPGDLLKEPLVLEFLGLDERSRYSESDLESAIITRIEQFLLELGKGFLFEARQKRFTFEEDHFFVDLVFYNRLLRRYVLVDLKLGKLAHQDLGQTRHWWRSPCQRTPTSTRASTSSICRVRTSYGRNSTSGPGRTVRGMSSRVAGGQSPIASIRDGEHHAARETLTD
jgi:predicted nuclease of restriction endonuclease-like (RecB) superfamily